MLLALIIAACGPGKVAGPGAVGETADSAPDSPADSPADSSADSPADSAPDSPVDTAPPPSTCFTWEDGDLSDAGFGGDYEQLTDGAILVIEAEGGDWSALNGEETLDFRDTYALVMRSSHDGDPDSVSRATTPAFEVTYPTLGWWQLSEVDKRGIYLGAELLGEDGAVLATLDIPVETGGFVPGLSEDQLPLDAFPEIVVGPGTPGALVQQVTDVSPWLGQTVRLQIVQHTEIDDNGFFTALDDLCVDELPGASLLTWTPAGARRPLSAAAPAPGAARPARGLEAGHPSPAPR